VAASIEVTDPRSGVVIGEIPVGDAASARQAVTQAAEAWPAWAALEQSDRCSFLRDGAEALEAELDSLVSIESKETGQAQDFVRGAISAAIDNWRHFATAAEGYDREPLASGGYIHRRSLGVAALIVPWNFPLLIAFRFLPGMLAVGNTVVWKPSERTPLSAIRAMEILEGVLPSGVATLLLGDGRAGRPLVEDDRVKLVALTGSTATGRFVAEESARRLRPVLLELGGKDAVIVDRDVDIEWAARLVADGCFTNTGQICTSIERVYVHRDIVEPFTDALVAIAEADWALIPEGGPMGPMIDRAQRDIVTRHIEDAVSQGAIVRTGGPGTDLPGAYLPPTVLSNVTHDMEVMRQETFGPVAPIMAFDTREQAFALAEDSDYGLSLSVLSSDEAMFSRAESADVGTVWLNTWHSYADGAIHQPGRSSGSGAVGWRGRQFLDAVSAPTFFGDPARDRDH
jgi:acyl-CoA reductase-like NAD-dependent aldehyde dehydrogenase